MIPVLLSFVLALFFFFYLVPFLLGYILGRFGGRRVARWGGWTVTALYLVWMLASWLGEGYSPLSRAHPISFMAPDLEARLYGLFTYLGLALASFYLVYSGAGQGARAACARIAAKEGEPRGPVV